MDLTYGRDRARQKEGLADPVSLDLESLVGMADLVSRMDLEIPGPGLTEVCLRSVAARKAWTVNHPRVGVRKAWIWNCLHAEAQMGLRLCRYPGHRRDSAQMERP